MPGPYDPFNDNDQPVEALDAIRDSSGFLEWTTPDELNMMMARRALENCDSIESEEAILDSVREHLINTPDRTVTDEIINITTEYTFRPGAAEALYNGSVEPPNDDSTNYVVEIYDRSDEPPKDGSTNYVEALDTSDPCILCDVASVDGVYCANCKPVAVPPSCNVCGVFLEDDNDADLINEFCSVHRTVSDQERDREIDSAGVDEMLHRAANNLRNDVPPLWSSDDERQRRRWLLRQEILRWEGFIENSGDTIDGWSNPEHPVLRDAENRLEQCRAELRQLAAEQITADQAFRIREAELQRKVDDWAECASAVSARLAAAETERDRADARQCFRDALHELEVARDALHRHQRAVVSSFLRLTERP